MRGFVETKYKWFRVDVNMWEEKKCIMGFYNYYVYSIWSNGLLITSASVIKKKGKAEYVKKAIKDKIVISEEELLRIHGLLKN